MKTLHQGELFSLDKRAPLAGQLALARKRFRVKHGCDPIDIHWNPGPFKDDSATEKPTLDRSLPPGHMWLELGG